MSPKVRSGSPRSGHLTTGSSVTPGSILRGRLILKSIGGKSSGNGSVAISIGGEKASPPRSPTARTRTVCLRPGRNPNTTISCSVRYPASEAMVAVSSPSLSNTSARAGLSVLNRHTAESGTRPLGFCSKDSSSITGGGAAQQLSSPAHEAATAIQYKRAWRKGQSITTLPAPLSATSVPQPYTARPRRCIAGRLPRRPRPSSRRHSWRRGYARGAPRACPGP